MIVEDEPTVLNTLKLKMERIGLKSFFIIATAYNAEEAWKIMNDVKVDVVISDIRMPGLGGLWLFEQIKKQYSDTICIALTAYNEFVYLQQSIRIGIDDYFLKPISEDQLKEKLISIQEKLEKRQEISRLYRVEKHLKNEQVDLCDRIDGYIQIHYAEKLSLKEIADFFGYNAQYLCELYRTKKNITIGDAIVEYRIAKAKEIISKNPEITFVKLASIVGYTDYRYFSRIFKKKQKLTLSEYKAELEGIDHENSV